MRLKEVFGECRDAALAAAEGGHSHFEYFQMEGLSVQDIKDLSSYCSSALYAFHEVVMEEMSEGSSPMESYFRTFSDVVCSSFIAGMKYQRFKEGVNG